jgi:hypothetical protein
MKRWSIKDVMDLQKKGLIKDILVPSRGKSAIIIPKQDAKEVQWMHWNLDIFCKDQCLVLKKEYRFHGERMWRFDFAIMELKIAIEYNGLLSNKSRHTTITGYSGDMEKLNAAQGLGWIVLQYTTLNYKNVLQDLKQILEARN